MLSILGIFFWGILKSLLIALGIVYFGLVLMAYRTEGPRCQFCLDWQRPTRAAQQLLVWLGVKILAASVVIGRTFLEMLSEASAEVGEWYLRRRGEAGATVRSRFL
jgi:hypothetical protein